MTTSTQADLFHCIREGRTLPPEIDEQFPFYPLDAPGMPLPGPDFIAAAMSLGDRAPTIEGQGKNQRLTGYGPNLHYLYRRALYDEQFSMPVMVRGVSRMAQTVPGHFIGDTTTNLNGGPRQARVMILGKNPGREELKFKTNFIGPTSEVFFDALDELGVGDTERAEWYITNLVKWPVLDDQSDSLPQAHKKDFALLLDQEIRLVRPDFILCLGSDASKFMLGTNYGVQSMLGRVANYTVPVFEQGEPVMYHTAKVMAVVHPAQVHRRPEMYDEFRSQIGLFLSLLNGADIGQRENFVDHRVVYKARELESIVEEIRNDPDPWRRVIALDGEWEKMYPTEPGAYLRTIQFSSKHGEGITVVLRHQGGQPAFQPSIGHAVQLLNRLCKYDPENNYFPRIGGHFLRADLPWLIYEGLDLRAEYAPAATPELCKHQGGWDTSLMYHAVNETASYRLTDMTVRLTTAPVYDEALKDTLAEYSRKHKLNKDEIEGFGMLPSWILHPDKRAFQDGHNYASYDPDVTRRIAVRHLQAGGMLDRDWNDNPSWEPFWVAHQASLGFLEMEMTGIMVDKDRVDQLTTLFMDAKERLLYNFRRQINWPDFNPDSAPQCVAFLFGDQYSKKLDKQTRRPIPVRPPGSLTLLLTPIKSTGKRSKLWEDIVARGETSAYTPSTDKEVLGIVGHAHSLAMQLRDLKFISKVLSGTLRPPVFTEDGNATDEDGNMVYSKGLASVAHKDGRVRTHLSQCKETGRAASARPPLQNISKRREGDYRRILGTWIKNKTTGQREAKGDYLPSPTHPEGVFQEPLYQHPIRSIFRASPGCVLVEADYTGAELAVIAWMANDPNMIEHVRRSCLPESHPEHYDIHGQTAVRVFHLNCEPTKSAIKKAGLESMRIAAKNVNFGVPYQRSADAISRQCREEGVDVSASDCQQVIDYYYNTYPGTRSFLESCKARTQHERWMCGCFGRRRRFLASRDRSVIGEQERQGCNFPIQNTVADAVSFAIKNFDNYRYEYSDVVFWRLLQIHDALLFEVPIPSLQLFRKGIVAENGTVIRPSVMDECMINRVPIWPRYLDNTPMNVAQPYHFGIESEVCLNWGEHITEQQARDLGIPLSLL